LAQNHIEIAGELIAWFPKFQRGLDEMLQLMKMDGRVIVITNYFPMRRAISAKYPLKTVS